MRGTPAPPDLTAARRLWLGGRPLEAGRALTALVSPGARARWAGRILAWAYVRSRIAPLPEIGAAIDATLGTPSPDEASAVAAALDAALLRAERSGRFDSLREAALTLARNAVQLLPGVAPEPFDPRLGWWFVASLKCVGDELEGGFAAEAWELLAQVE